MLLPTPAAHALLERTPSSDARVDFGPVMLFCNPNAMCGVFFSVRDLGHNASVFYAIFVILHPFFYAILVILYPFFRRDARSASCSVPFARKSRKITMFSRKIVVFRDFRANGTLLLALRASRLKYGCKITKIA